MALGYQVTGWLGQEDGQGLLLDLGRSVKPHPIYSLQEVRVAVAGVEVCGEEVRGGEVERGGGDVVRLVKDSSNGGCLTDVAPQRTSQSTEVSWGHCVVPRQCSYCPLVWSGGRVLEDWPLLHWSPLLYRHTVNNVATT